MMQELRGFSRPLVLGTLLVLLVLFTFTDQYIPFTRDIIFGSTTGETPENVYKGTTDMGALRQQDRDYFTRLEANNADIPRQLIMTWKDINEVPKEVILSWSTLNPDWEIILFDDARIVKFLREDYGESHVKFFNDIVFGRHKADFFRYCYLYKRGGVYADIDLDPKVSIDSFLAKDTRFFSVRKENENTIFQAYIASAPAHPILRLAIGKMMEIGPRIGVDPPETRPFSEYHPTVCMYRIIEYLLGDEPKPGRWETPYGSLQLASEASKMTPGLFKKHRGELHIFYDGVPIALSRRPEYNQESGYTSQ